MPENVSNEVVNNVIGKLNVYTILQFFWIVEMYYLGSNAIFRVLTFFHIKLGIPILIKMKNDVIMQYIEEYISFSLYFGLTMFICGALYWSLIKINIIAKYKLISQYSDYGISLGGWLIFMYITYFIYKEWCVILLLMPIVIAMIIKGFRRLNEYLDEHFGIAFNYYDKL